MKDFVSAKNIHENSNWDQLTPGAEIYEGGTSRMVKTGEWRVMTPILSMDKCRQCLLCVPFCPDVAIPVTGGKRLETDMDYCKGCGICAKMCKFGALQMEGDE